jgi:hypothetical protein
VRTVVSRYTGTPSTKKPNRAGSPTDGVRLNSGTGPGLFEFPAPMTISETPIAVLAGQRSLW